MHLCRDEVPLRPYDRIAMPATDRNDESDEALMQAYAAGDVAAFARLYDRHERPVHRFFLRQAVPPQTADDLLQETWLAIVRNAAGYTVDAKFTTWLYTIARSKLVDHWRATKRTRRSTTPRTTRTAKVPTSRTSSTALPPATPRDRTCRPCRGSRRPRS